MDGHRHLPEITQELGALTQERLSITFVTHLIPMTRGILSTCYAHSRPGRLEDGDAGVKQLREVYQDFYANHPFVRITAQPPQTKQTLGNNVCLLYPTLDQRTGRVVVVSCLDNLVKGAAGQAVQNMNLMCGFPEEESLGSLAVYP
mgnify:CR=1 FL=1